MSVVVRNDGSIDIRLPGGGNDRVIHVDQVITLTDGEWERVPFSKRGYGKLLCINPDEASSDSMRTQLDWFTEPISGEVKIRYQGIAPQGTTNTDALWIVKRFSYADFGGTVEISDIQILVNVAWGTTQADRDSLSWT
jgi:hypothetical protein